MPTVLFNERAYTIPAGSLISQLPPFQEIAAAPCGGHGICGKCRVWAEGALSPLSEDEQRLLTPHQLAEGMRLACRTRILGDATIRTVPENSSAKIRVEGDMPALSLSPLFSRYGVALDIGTTTLAARLYRADGQVLAEAVGLNPQSAYGADVISRIEAALKGEGAALARLVREAIDRLTAELAVKAGIDSHAIDAMVITGNTVMLHLLTETSVEPLSHAPFAAKRLFGECLTADSLALSSVSPQATVYLPPCVGAYVGADLVTALLASDICSSDQTALLVDIGTNGEMALYHNRRLTFCSTAAGPAFEGAGISMGMGGREGAIDRVCLVNGRLTAHVIGGTKPVGICGSGVVDAIACLLDLELLDETGYLEEDPAVIESPVAIIGADVRAVQLAKSAIHAGILTLLHTAGLSPKSVTNLSIAGGFGSYLNIASACKIGLLPQSMQAAVRVIGNAALSGAAMLLLCKDLQKTCQGFAQGQVLELSTNPIFADQYMEQMLF